MFFWFKKKKIVLDCFTYDFFAHEYCKPDLANKFYPEWFKDLNNEIPTLKQCIAFADLYKNSFILPFWDTFTIDFKNKNNNLFLDFASGEGTVDLHTRLQYNGVFGGGKNIEHIKLISPWLFKTKNSLQFLWHAPLWNYESLNNLHLLPAIVNYKYNYDTAVNFMFDTNITSEKIVLTPCTPLVMLTPLNTIIQEIDLRTHLVEGNSFVKMFKAKEFRLLTRHSTLDGTSASKLYSLKKKFIDNNDKIQKENKKCPFGFGKK